MKWKSDKHLTGSIELALFSSNIRPSPLKAWGCARIRKCANYPTFALNWYDSPVAQIGMIMRLMIFWFSWINLIFFLGLIDNESRGGVILDPKVIALRYVKTWFFVDFVSSLPLDYVFLGIEGQSYTAGRALRILRLAKLLQLLRLLRISRLVRYVRLWQEVSRPRGVRLSGLSNSTLERNHLGPQHLTCEILHWSSCMQKTDMLNISPSKYKNVSELNHLQRT